MKTYEVKGQYYFEAESQADFSGWEIIGVRPWKPGVSQVHVRFIPPGILSKAFPAEFRIIYAADEHVPTEFRKVAL
jgi:hypothetical protein